MKADAKFMTAIHICLYLQFRGEKVLSSQELAVSVDTNPVVIRRLTTDLRAAGIVGSSSGKQGGFFLIKKIKDINLWNIYQAVNHSDLFHRPKVNAECPVSSNLSALIENPFKSAEMAMKGPFENTSLEDLFTQLQTILTPETEFSNSHCKPVK